MARLFSPFVAGFDDNGRPRDGAKLYTYAAGTSTPKATFSDAAMTTPHANPVVANSAGLFPEIFGRGSYKLVLRDKNDALVQTLDGVDFPGPATVTAPGSGGLSQDVADILNNWLTDERYSTLAQAVAAAAGKTLWLTKAHTITAAISIPAGTMVCGLPQATVTQTTSGQNAFTVSGDDVTIEGVTFVGTNSGMGSAIYGNGADNLTVRGCRVRSWRFGVQLFNCKNYLIDGNRYWGGTADGGTSADVFVYGNASSPNRRGVITNNWCLSNNDNGISIGTNNGDREVVVDSNIVIPCDADGMAELDAADVRRRFGIVVGYNGGSDIRGVISNNIVRLIGYAGIYTQGATLPNGTNNITGNLVSRCGFGTFFPADASLRAGILYLSGGVDAVAANVVVDCSTAGIKTGTDFGYSAANAPRATFTGNTIARTAGYGIWCTNKPAHLTFDGNDISGTVGFPAVYLESTSTDAGGVVFRGGRVETSGDKGAFQLAASVGGSDLAYPVSVDGVQIVGNDNTTNDQFNSAVWWQGNVSVRALRIKKYHRGVHCADTVNSRRLDRVADGLVLEDCAIGLNGAGTGTLVAQNARFLNCTTNVNGVYVNGAIIGGGLVMFASAAAPSSGAWEQGDRATNSFAAVGSPKGWLCTVAGSPGTWVSEGNL